MKMGTNPAWSWSPPERQATVSHDPEVAEVRHHQQRQEDRANREKTVQGSLLTALHHSLPPLVWLREPPQPEALSRVIVEGLGGQSDTYKVEKILRVSGRGRGKRSFALAGKGRGRTV